MKPIGVDTSLAVPLLLRNHRAHAAVSDWWRGRPLALAGHALAETYSVLTRLPAPLRLLPVDAAQLLSERFARPLTLDLGGFEDFPFVLARKGIFGGATYDALVALAAVEHDAELATRDERARRTYDAIGARVIAVAV